MAETELMRPPDMPLHDPFIVADKKTRAYHLYTANDPSVSGVDGTGTMVYRSHHLCDWMRPARHALGVSASLPRRRTASGW